MAEKKNGTRKVTSECSNSSSGGVRSSKKLKQKKIPQRGLGVAQLEKIRLEEQQKKVVAAAAASASAAVVVVPLPHSHHQSPTSTSFRPPSPTAFPSPRSLFRPSSLIPISNLDLFTPPPHLPPTNSTTLYNHGYFPSVWNPSELNHNGEGTNLDPGFVFRAHLQSESNPIWSPPVVMQRKQQQRPSSVVNVSLFTSSSSGLNVQMEPPSNQSYYSNYTPPLWPEQEKIVGMKRPWPFSFDGLPDPSFPCKFPPLVPPIGRLNESSSCGDGGKFNFELGNSIFRKGHINRRGCLSELHRENGALDGDFLTLGLAANTSCSTSSKSKQPSTFPTSHCREFDLLPFQGSIGEQVFYPGGSVQEQPFYSFFPTKGQQIGDWRGEVGDGVDLNLKL